MTTSDEEDLVYGFQEAHLPITAVPDQAIKEHLVILGLNYSSNGRTCRAHPIYGSSVQIGSEFLQYLDILG
jgi:hypothetical protein